MRGRPALLHMPPHVDLTQDHTVEEEKGVWEGYVWCQGFTAARSECKNLNPSFFTLWIWSSGAWVWLSVPFKKKTVIFDFLEWVFLSFDPNMDQTESLNSKPSCIHTILGNLIDGSGATETPAPLPSPRGPRSHSSEDVVYTGGSFATCLVMRIVRTKLGYRGMLFQ